MCSSLQDYLHRIRAIPPLPAAIEPELAAAIQAWLQHDQPPLRRVRSGQRALRRLVIANLGLVVCLVDRQIRRHPQSGAEILDLVQAGNLGLIRAAERFDPEPGARFAAFASWWINQAIQRHHHDCLSLIRPPDPILQLASRARDLQHQRAIPLNRDQISRALGITPERLNQVLELQRRIQLVSLDRVEAMDSEHHWVDAVQAHRHSPEIEETYDWLHGLLLQLCSAERQVLAWRYLAGSPTSIARIAERIGMSQSQIQRCEQRALRKLRHRVASRAG